MIGHQTLLQSRLRGRMPRCVSIYLLAAKPDDLGGICNPEKSLELGQLPSILIMDSDVPDALDLRCVRGMLVMLHGASTWSRLISVFDRLMDFDPRQVVATGMRNGQRIFVEWTPETFKETTL